jgi:3-deoxy-D-manno-octulosonate 8-phosphate phosphatase (KDO 8-P phosphatase)
MTERPAPYNPGSEKLSQPWHRPRLLNRLSMVDLVVFDVDGTLTDGTIGVTSAGGVNGRLLLFNTRDGHGFGALKKAGIPVAWCTTNPTDAIRSRFQALGLDYLIQGREDKKTAIEELGIPWNRIAYMGDDLADLVPMRLALVSAAPRDAHKVALEQATWVSDYRGGRGAARQLCDLILEAKGFDLFIDTAAGTAEYRKVDF